MTRRAPDSRVGHQTAANAAHGHLPLGWLHATGCVEAVLVAWGRGALAEVPVGPAFDVVRVPLELAHETVRHLREAEVPLGPVLAPPGGAEFVVESGTADGWAIAGSTVLSRGSLLVMPHPAFVDPYRLGGRCWIVGPTDGPLTCGADLQEAYAEARADAAAADALT